MVSNFIDVLVIEQNLNDQKLLVDYLMEYGLSFKLVSGSVDVVQILEQTSFKLILLNAEWFEKENYKAVRTIRNELKISVPIVGMIAWLTHDLKEKYFEAGMDACFSKPINKVEFVGVLTQFLLNEKSSSEGQNEDYNIIDLSYLRELSLGDKEYEKEITGKFIEMISVDLDVLNQRVLNGDYSELRQQLHNMLSTVSIMGLTSMLRTHIQTIESKQLSISETRPLVETIHEVCQAAKEEASLFLQTLN